MAPRPQPLSSFGPPTVAELAYLAGLIDRAGGLLLGTPGVKIRCGRELGGWLEDRFGGRWYSGYWWLRKQAEVRDTLSRLDPYLIERQRAARSVRARLQEPPATRSA